MVGFEKRIDVIHLYKYHHLSIQAIAKKIGKNCVTIKHIINHFNATGRINKLLTVSAKRLILQKRNHKATLKSQSDLGDIAKGSICLQIQISENGPDKTSLVTLFSQTSTLEADKQSIKTWIDFQTEEYKVEKSEFPTAAVDCNGRMVLNSNQSEIFLAELTGFNLADQFERKMLKPYMQLPQPNF